jgi:hypothetical protein
MKGTQKKQETQLGKRILSRVGRFGVYWALEDEERAEVMGKGSKDFKQW